MQTHLPSWKEEFPWHDAEGTQFLLDIVYPVGQAFTQVLEKL